MNDGTISSYLVTSRTTMATRSKKLTSNNVTGRMIMPEISPRDTDVKFTGGEPIIATQPDSDRRALVLVSSFNWYSRFFDRKMAKEQLANYADYINKSEIAKQIRRADEKEVMATLGWLARLYMRGLDLTDHEQERLDAEIKRVAATASKPEIVEKTEAKVTNRPNVQEIMRDKAREAAGDLEGELDEFIIAGAKTAGVSVNSVGVLTEHNVLPQHVSILTEVWRKKLNEFQAVAAGKDVQLTQAYAHYSKTQIKAVIKFCEQVLSGLESYISVKKASKAPRTRKPVSPEKQASKVKFMKSFDELNLVSVHPAKIIGATEAWLYDTAKRKLWYLVADPVVGVLGVKGSTILGFDSSKSGIKTIRKPADLLKKFMTAGKPATRKLFTEINSVQAQPNGRTNENLVILKAY